MLQPFRIKQLIHCGILIPTYEPKGFSIVVRGKRIQLTPEQEEMATAWVKKLETDYVKDPVFVKNFFSDFSKALGLERPAAPEDFDFSEIQRWLEDEKIKKERLTREERKRLAEERKRIREENKKKYGYAIVNSERVEIGNYMAEPPCIFMGRGKHPLRGRWKPRISYSDIILNLSEDATTPPTPTGEEWGGRTFEPNALWVAKWRDKLTGDLKYVWIADSARFKQMREIEKFNAAWELENYIDRVRQHIQKSLTSEDPLRRKVATVAYLIDSLKLRVGDEKDRDEANTVGATTLRGSHVKINPDGTVGFDFVGKDFVRWVKRVKFPPVVVENLKSFIGKPREQIFKGVRSELVNAFLGEAMPGLTAKVFRTYHATKIVQDYLTKNEIPPAAPEPQKKYVATLANLQAAIACHHKRKLPKGWKESLTKKTERLEAMKKRLAELKEKHRTLTTGELKRFRERIAKKSERLEMLKVRLRELREKRPTPSRKKRIRKLRERIIKGSKLLDALRKDFREKRKRRRIARAKQIERQRERIEAAMLKLDLAKATKDFNLGTSLKSYIDPRVYAIWAEKMSYDWKRIYPKSLQRKFAWVEEARLKRK